MKTVNLFKLKNFQAIVNTEIMAVYLQFEDELLVVSLLEGDLEDNWNSVTMDDGRIFDFNLYWESSMRSPMISIYATYQEKGEEHLRTDFSKSYSFHILRAYKSKKQYFNNNLKTI